MKILLAGIQDNTKSQEIIKYLSKSKMGVLYSALNERRKIDKYRLKNFLFVDSGAHSWNKLTIQNFGHKGKKELPNPIKFYEEYANYIQSNADKNYTFVELDIYAVLKKDILDDFYKQIKKIKGNFKFIRVYHPIIDNGDLSELKKWVKQGQDYIGIGNDSTPILNNVFSITRDKIKFHGFAMTNKGLLEKYPFYTCDSTTWLVGSIYAGYWSNKKHTGIGKKFLIKNKKLDIIKTVQSENIYDINLRWVKGMNNMQNYITKLWKYKGVEWNE